MYNELAYLFYSIMQKQAVDTKGELQSKDEKTHVILLNTLVVPSDLAWNVLIPHELGQEGGKVRMNVQFMMT
jgi:hypothetical protein